MMMRLDVHHPISRRRALGLGGSVTAGGLLAGTPVVGVAAARSSHVLRQSGKLPADEIEKIVQAEGTVTNGVLSIDLSRDDIGDVKGPLGVTFDGSFEIDGTLTFQPLGKRLAFFNGDLPLKPGETQGFIDAVLANLLTFQAFHQHYIEMTPQVWFIHWRGVGEPLALARAVHNVLKTTAISLPQKMPSHPKSPLDAKRLGSILHGDAQIGDNGSVSVSVSRRGRIVIGDVHASPEANISTMVEFKPIGTAGGAAVGPDFSMTGDEAENVVAVMRKHGWFVGCLYNQETSEKPQLYFSHMLKKGDAYALAAEVREGLDKTNAD
jgi:uncharacterized protein DUF1259